MRHSAVSEEIIEIAVLYALGVLSQSETRAFEDHQLECDVCSRERAVFEEVISNLAYLVAPQSPPPELRDRLLGEIAEEATSEKRGESNLINSATFLSIRADEGEWQELMEGVMIKPLHFDKALGLATSLMKMKPGARLPEHSHAGVEQFYILEGTCQVNGETLGPGDYHRAEAGSRHGVTYTENGTMFLLVAPLKYDFGISR